MIRRVDGAPSGSQPPKRREPSREVLALSEQVAEASVTPFKGIQKTAASQGRIPFNKGVKKGSKTEKETRVFSRIFKKNA